ncbi:MAG: hypothetical protein WDZ77_01760 [Candidatus Pacearchaeota archaeon]
MTKTIVNLPSSEEALFHPDGSTDEDVLVKLIGEAYERNLDSETRIRTHEKYLSIRTDFPTEDDLDFKECEVTYEELNNYWRDLGGAFNDDYSPDAELERIKFMSRYR